MTTIGFTIAHRDNNEVIIINSGICTLITTLQTAINAGCEMRVEDGADYLPCEPDSRDQDMTRVARRAGMGLTDGLSGRVQNLQR